MEKVLQKINILLLPFAGTGTVVVVHIEYSVQQLTWDLRRATILGILVVLGAKPF